MPVYEFTCPACDETFDRVLSMSARDEPQACPACSETATRVISMPSFVLSGDDWPGKAHKINRQMAEKNLRLDAKQTARKKDAPGVTLAPNVGGERVDSWADAQKLAASRGKDTATYDAKVRSEKVAKK